MRQFYLEYKENKKLQPLVGEISWTKNVIIMSRCKDDQQKEFYLRMTKKWKRGQSKIWTRGGEVPRTKADNRGSHRTIYAGVRLCGIHRGP